VLARAASAFLKTTQEREAAVARSAATEHEAAGDRRRVLQEMAQRVEAQTIETVGAVAATAEQVRAGSAAMKLTLERAGASAEEVDVATAGAVEMTDRAAQIAGEIGLAIAEVTEQISRGHAVSQEAVSRATDSRATIEALNEAAQQIGDFISIISDLAEQTNLLALNATIEAARAGDMGRGFGVVATEVKALAAQTNKSASEIADRVSQIQERTQTAVSAIAGIADSVDRLGEVTAAVAAAMEEQKAATGTFGRFISDNKQALVVVARQVSALVKVARSTANDAAAMADTVDRMSAASAEAKVSIPAIVSQAVAAADRRSDPRLPAAGKVHVEGPGGARDVPLKDISRGGARLGAEIGQKGQPVEVSSGRFRAPARVVWAKGGESGVRFAAPLPEGQVNQFKD
jgi:methyl-accepting chemotaxis protein